MRPELSIITLFRSPVKTLVTFILLTATSFAFVARGAEYAATVRETKRAEAEYSAVGTIQRGTNAYYDYMENALGEYAEVYERGGYMDRFSPAVAPLEREAAGLVLSSKYVKTGETFHVAGGESEGLRNVPEQPLYDILDYSEWSWQTQRNYGTFGMQECAAICTLNSTYLGVKYFALEREEDIVVGAPEFWRAPMSNIPAILDTKSDEAGQLFGKASWGHRFLIFFRYLDSPVYVINNLIDYPVIDLTLLEENYGTTDYMAALREPEKYGLARSENPAGLPTLSALEYLNRLERNQVTSELVFVDDMDSIHTYHKGNMYITDGRALEPGENADVCVVSAEYAALNDIELGDTVEFEITADTMVHSGKIFAREPMYTNVYNPREHRLLGYYIESWGLETAAAAVEHRLSDLGLEPVTRRCTVVGTWADSRYDAADPYTYSPNTIFVPESAYPWPDEVEPRLMPSNFSFTLEHPGDMALIQDELGSELAALGYELVINDEGYAAAKPSFDFMRLSSLIGFVGMALALLVSLLLITYLFIIRKKHDYAIMRALGTPVPRANASLLVGLSALALAAVLLGTALAVAATSGFASELSARIGEVTGGDASAALPLWTFGAFGAGTLALLLAFARIGLSKVGRIPPLVLLQGK